MKKRLYISLISIVVVTSMDVTSVLSTFTRGEAGGTGGLTTQENLGAVRTEELKKICRYFEY